MIQFTYTKTKQTKIQRKSVKPQLFSWHLTMANISLQQALVYNRKGHKSAMQNRKADLNKAKCTFQNKHHYIKADY